MPESSADFLKKGDLFKDAMAANATELAHLEVSKGRFEVLLTEMRGLTVQQADLTAQKQEISKRLAVLLSEGRKLLTFLKVGVTQHFGNRAEKLVAFGLQPFRSQPRIKLVGLDGKPLEKSQQTTEREAPAQTPNQ
jgi:hypothetical protein